MIPLGVKENFRQVDPRFLSHSVSRNQVVTDQKDFQNQDRGLVISKNHFKNGKVVLLPLVSQVVSESQKVILRDHSKREKEIHLIPINHDSQSHFVQKVEMKNHSADRGAHQAHLESQEDLEKPKAISKNLSRREKEVHLILTYQNFQSHFAQKVVKKDLFARRVLLLHLANRVLEKPKAILKNHSNEEMKGH